jgi:hypothetical protein
MAVTDGERRARARPWLAALPWALCALAILGSGAAFWFDHLLRQAGRADLIQMNASALPWLLALVTAATVGAVLATRRPRHPVGWLLLGLGLSIGLSGFADGYAPMACWHGPGRSRRPAGPPSTALRWSWPPSPVSASCCC